ncbi:MAG: hypothetical protein U1F49_21200 [Rubrivivax sp.]
MDSGSEDDAAWLRAAVAASRRPGPRWCSATGLSSTPSCAAAAWTITTLPMSSRPSSRGC